MGILKPITFASPGLETSTVNVAQSLAAAGYLQKWIIPWGFRPGTSWLSRAAGAVSPRLQALLSGRLVPEQLASFVQCYPLYEFCRIAAARLGLGPMAAHRVWHCAENNFDRYVAENWTGWTPIFYGCENAAVISFRRHKQAGGLNLLWQVIAHQTAIERVLEHERAKFPALGHTYRRLERSSRRTNERKEEQIQQADLILANSDFVRRTFMEAGFAAERVTAVPTPCPPPPATGPVRPAPQRPLVFLNAGTLCVRKGIHLLLEAWRRLDPGSAAELWLVGTKELPESIFRDVPGNVVLRPRVPRTELTKLFCQADVFVLPTLCEGRANVVLEALSHGVPVLTTPQSGCDDLVKEGETGWLVPPCDVEALASKMQTCLERPGRLREMGQAAQTAARRWQLPDFIRRHNAVIHEFMTAHGIYASGEPCRVSGRVVTARSHNPAAHAARLANSGL